IHVFPDLNLVVVFTNDLTPGSANAMQNVALMSDYVLPAALGTDWSVAFPWAWPALVGLSLLALLWDLDRHRPRPWAVWLSWAWIVLVFGPLGLGAYWITSRGDRDREAYWPRALAASLYCAAGNAAGFCLLFILVAFLQPQVDLLLPALVFPLLVGWLAFRAPAFAHQAGQGYGRALRRTLLAEVSTALPALAGMLPAIILLQSRWFPAGNLNPADPLFWLMIGTAATAGVLLAYPINYWLARRGFATWPVAPGEDGGDRPGAPSLRSAWWAPLAGIVVLVAALGLALTALS
ncbi:MAG: DUF4396 domain-containing protein, partial [Anaerolineae bacterium]